MINEESFNPKEVFNPESKYIFLAYLFPKEEKTCKMLICHSNEKKTEMQKVIIQTEYENIVFIVFYIEKNEVTESNSKISFMFLPEYGDSFFSTKDYQNLHGKNIFFFQEDLYEIAFSKGQTTMKLDKSLFNNKNYYRFKYEDCLKHFITFLKEAKIYENYQENLIESLKFIDINDLTFNFICYYLHIISESKNWKDHFSFIMNKKYDPFSIYLNINNTYNNYSSYNTSIDIDLELDLNEDMINNIVTFLVKVVHSNTYVNNKKDLYILILIFYNVFEKKELYILLEKLEYEDKKSLLNYIFRTKYKESIYLNESIIILLLDSINSEEEFDSFYSGCVNPFKYLARSNSKFIENLNNIYSPQDNKSNELKLDKKLKYEKVNIKELFEFYLIYKFSQKNYYQNISMEKVINHLIYKNSNNFERLTEIKNEFYRYKENPIIKKKINKHIKKVNSDYHNLGISMFKSNGFTGIEQMIIFFTYDSENCSKLKDKEIDAIADHLLDIIKDEYKSEYLLAKLSYSLRSYFDKEHEKDYTNFSKFMEKLYNNVKDYKGFYCFLFFADDYYINSTISFTDFDFFFIHYREKVAKVFVKRPKSNDDDNYNLKSLLLEKLFVYVQNTCHFGWEKILPNCHLIFTEFEFFKFCYSFILKSKERYIGIDEKDLYKQYQSHLQTNIINKITPKKCNKILKDLYLCEEIEFIIFFMKILDNHYIKLDDLINNSNFDIIEIFTKYQEKKLISYLHMDLFQTKYLKLTLNNIDIFQDKLISYEVTLNKIDPLIKLVNKLYISDNEEKTKYNKYLVDAFIIFYINSFFITKRMHIFNMFNLDEMFKQLKKNYFKLLITNINQFPVRCLTKFYDNFYYENILSHSKFFNLIYDRIKNYNTTLEYIKQFELIFNAEEENINEKILNLMNSYFKYIQKYLSKNNINLNYIENKIEEKFDDKNKNSLLVSELHLYKYYFKKNLSAEEINKIYNKIIITYNNYVLINYFKGFEFLIIKLDKLSNQDQESSEPNPDNSFMTELKNAITYNKNLCSKDTTEKINEFLIKHNLTILYNYSNKYLLKILMKIQNYPEIIDFLKDKQEQDLRSLEEFGEDGDITIADMQNLFEALNFIIEINNNNYKELSFVNNIISFCSNNYFLKNFKNLHNTIENISYKINSIRLLYNSITDKSTNEINMKKQIVTDSTFGFNINLKLLNIECKLLINNNEVPYNKFVELKDKYLDKGNYSDYYNDLYFKICRLNKIINKLLKKGYYTDKFKFTLFIKDQKESADFKSGSKTLDELLTYFNSIYKSFKKKLIEFYTENVYYTMIYGNLFQLIYLNYKNKKFNEPITNLKLKNFKNYVGSKKLSSNENNLINADDSFINKNDGEDDETSSIFYWAKKFISDTLESNKSTTINFYLEKNKFNEHFLNKYKGLYYTNISQDKIDEYLLSLYIQLTNNPPENENILICNYYTEKEELFSFLFRALHCKSEILFTLILPEYLNLQCSEKLFDMLKNTNKMNSCLIIIFSNTKCELSVKILELNSVLLKDSDIQLYKEINTDSFFTNLTLVYSEDSAGVGKSTYIERHIKQSLKKEYNYIQLGGQMNESDIIDRLSSLNITNNSVIHLDLYECRQEETMKKFLYNFLITNTYHYKDNYFYYNNKFIKIIIEIPFGFVNMLQQFPILNLIHKRTIFNLNTQAEFKLTENDEDYKNVQLVANYLLLYKENKIDKFTLTYEKIKSKTAIEMKQLDIKDCYDLIRTYIGIEVPTYYQITSFVRILASQLKLFMNNIYLKIETLKANKRSLSVRTIAFESFLNISTFLSKGAYESLLKTERLANDILIGDYNIAFCDVKAIEQLERRDSIIFFKEIIGDNNLIFFNEDKQSLSILVNMDSEANRNLDKKSIKNKNLDEYQKLKLLWNSCKDKSKKDEELDNFETMDRNALLNKIIIIFDLKCNVQQLEKMLGNYVFTLDNIFKMILILIKLRAGSPVIMMGETGCGKTFLFRTLANLRNEKKLIKNIHAGIKESDIISFMKEVFEVSSKEEKGKKIWVFFDEINTCNSMGILSEIICKRRLLGNPIPDNLYIIAACNPYRTLKSEYISQGLLKKDKSKKKAIVNLVYMVNPLPFSLLNYVFDFGNLKPEDEKKYFEFMIREELYKSYTKLYKNHKVDDRKFRQHLSLVIESIATSQLFIKQKSDISCVSLREGKKFIIFYEWFLDYFESNLNDIEIFQTKQNNTLGKGNQSEIFNLLIDENEEQKREKILIYSVVLSLYMNYFLRLSSEEDRYSYIDTVKKKLRIDNILLIIEENLDFLISQIDVPIGIAKNKILRQNIFALFICINTKIPIFICGKPGCSKSLSFNLLFNNMRGQFSSNEFFMKYPRLFMQSYQGALSSTSEGVLKIFNKARNAKNKNKNKNSGNINNKEDFISVVFFDELGLAELAPENPLKVLNYELESYKDDFNDSSSNLRNDIAFVGISNWSLDSSKLNRGIFLSILDMKEEDLLNTALTIMHSYDADLDKKYNAFIEILTFSYDKYKYEIKKNKKFNDFIDFHSSRDFYHLIKLVSKKLSNIQKNKEKEVDLNNISDLEILFKIGIDCINQNFGGNVELPRLFKDIYKESFINRLIKADDFNSKKLFNELEQNNEFNIKDYIKNSLDLSNHDNRYLLLVTNSSTNLLLVQKLLESLNKKSIFLLGSNFDMDKTDENYSINVLNHLQNLIGEPDILVLNGLEIIYPSLYDLFNQNFTYIGKKKTVRIAVGSANNIQVIVNENFRCIILIEEHNLLLQDPPFLNRFEKYIINYDILLNQFLNKLSEEIVNFFNSLIIPDNEKISLIGKSRNNAKIKIDLKPQLLGMNDPEKIKCLVYTASKEDDINQDLTENDDKSNNADLNEYKEKIIDKVLQRVSPTLSQDLVSFMKLSKSYSNPATKEYVNKLYKYYKENQYFNYESFLYDYDCSSKSIIFTFSRIFDKVRINFSSINANNKNKIEFTSGNVDEIYLSTCVNENDISNYLSDYYQNNNKILTVIKLRLIDSIHLNHIIYLIKNIEMRFNQKKGVILIIYLERYLQGYEYTQNDDYYFNYINSHMSTFKQIFIDNLNGERYQLEDDISLLEKPLVKPITKLNKLIIENIITNSILYLDYNFYPYNYDYCTAIYQSKLINFFIKKKNDKEKDNLDEDISNLYFKSLIDKIASFTQNLSNNFTLLLFYIYDITRNDIDFFKTFQKNTCKIFENAFTDLFILIENNNLIPNIDNEELNNEKLSIELYKFYISGLDKLEMSNVKSCDSIKSNKINKLVGMNIPLSKKCFEELREITVQICEDYFQCEQNLRTYGIQKEEFDISENKYITNINNIIYELNQSDIFNILKGIKNEKEDVYNQLVELLIDDYYHYFVSLFYNNNNYMSSNNIDVDDAEINKTNEKTKKLINDMKILLKLIVKLRFYNNSDGNDLGVIDKNSDLTLQFIKIFLWCESHSAYINLIFEIYMSLSNEKDNLLSEIEENITKYNIKIEDENDYYNKGFFEIVESTLKILNENINKFILSNKNNLNSLISKFQEIENKSKRLEIVLWLSSNEFKTFSFFNQLLMKNSNNNIDLFNELIAESDKENKLLKGYLENESKERKEKLKNNLISQYDLLKNNFQEIKNSEKLYIEFFKLKYTKNKNVNYRSIILDIILSDDSLIIISLPLLIKYLNSGIIKPEDILISNYNENLEDININELDYNDFFTIKSNKYLSKFDDFKIKNSINLELLLINLFNYKFNMLFANETSNLFYMPLHYFKCAVKYLNDLLNNKINSELRKISEILKIYSICYVKIYLLKLYELNFNQKLDMSEMNRFNLINNLWTNEYFDKSFIKILQFYIIKIFKNKLIYIENIKKYDWDKHKMKWIINLGLGISENEILLKNYFYYNKNENKNMLQLLNILLESNFNNDLFIKSIDESLREALNSSLDASISILNYYDFIVNEFISKLTYFDKAEIAYKNFIAWSKSNFSSLSVIQQSTMNILELLFDYTPVSGQNTQSSNNKLFSYKNIKLLSNEDNEGIQILLYCFKIALIVSTFENSFYNKIFAKNSISLITSSYIPGIDNYSLLEKSYIDIKKDIANLKETSLEPGLYICECGYYYKIHNGLPTSISQCKYCDKKIGGFANKLKESTYRIFLNKNHLNNFKKEYNIDEFYNYRLIEDIESDIKMSKSFSKGIKKTDEKSYLKLEQKIRSLNIISIRVCLILFYSCVYFANKLNYISNNDFYKELLPFSTNSLFEIIKINWNSLKIALLAIDIDNIFIFFNMLFEKLPFLLDSFRDFETEENRNLFEIKMKSLIDLCIEKYNEYKIKYYKFNKDEDSINSFNILNETINPDIIIYHSKEYPYYFYFLLEKYPSETDIQMKLCIKYNNFFNKFPVLSNYLFNKSEVEKLNKLKHINKFSNFLINNFSYSIKREDAIYKYRINSFMNEKMKFKNMDEKQQKRKDIENFIQAYNSFSSKNLQYKAEEIKEKIVLDKDSPVCYCMNDIIGTQGKILAGIYDRLINLHNDYFDNIFNNSSEDSYANYYKEEVNKLISIQNAKDNQLLSLDIKDDLDNINSFNQLIYLCSIKDCNVDEEAIDKSQPNNIANSNIYSLYSNLMKIDYDFELIDSILTKIIFSCKRKFSNDQKFFIYSYEGNLNDSESLFIKYISKYQQVPIKEEEKVTIQKILDLEPEKILFSIQKLMGIILNGYYKSDSLISEIINKIPNFTELNESCFNLFNKSDYNIKNLFSIYEYIEELCKDILIKNISPCFKCEINKENLKIYIKNFKNLKEKNELTECIRKYICRYLGFKQEFLENNNTILEQNLFDSMVNKKDLWTNGQKSQLLVSIFKENFEGVVLKNCLTFYNCVCLNENEGFGEKSNKKGKYGGFANNGGIGNRPDREVTLKNSKTFVGRRRNDDD